MKTKKACLHDKPFLLQLKLNMKKYHLKTFEKKILADTLTPVSVYLKLRDHFPNTLLLESSDYHANDNSFSYVCFNPIANIEVHNNEIKENFPNGLTGTAGTFTGNLNVAGVLTYEDVTNVDSVGLITARAGVNLVGNDLNVGSNIKIGNARNDVLARPCEIAST